MSGTGPVEPADTTGAEPSYDVIGADSPRLSDRWRELPPRVRRGALATVMAAALAAGALLLPSPPAAAPHDPRPAPWPATVTEFHYTGVDDRPAPGTPGAFHFDVSVEYGPPVTVGGISAAFTGLHARTTPQAPFTVHTGTTRRITVQISVSDCSGLPLNADLPFLDVTLSNTRAIQHHSFIFGGAYPRDLNKLLHAACDSA